MHDPQHARIHRELFLVAFGANVGVAEPWVTDRLTSLLEEQRARAGDKLFMAGDPPEFYYFLREGRVQLVREGSASWTYESRSVFGMSDALLERPRVRTAVALTDIEAMRVQSEAWIELLEDSFALARAAVLGSVRIVAELEAKSWSARGSRRFARPAARGHHGELDVLERLALLTEAPLLRAAGVQTLSDLASLSDVVSFAAGERLLERGKADGRVLLLAEGEVEARRDAPDARWLGGPGDVVCGTAAFGESIDAWEARARTPARALTFRVEDWIDLMEAHFDLVRSTLGALSLDREQLLEELGGTRQATASRSTAG